MTLRDYLARVLLLVGLCAPAMAQSPYEPQGPDDHPEYADGVMCSPAGDVHWVPGQGWRTLNAHECKCHRMAMDPKDCDSMPIEDGKCFTFCKKHSCTCPVECDMPGHGDAR